MSTLSENVSEFINQTKKLAGDIDINHIYNDVSYYLNLTDKELDNFSKEDCVRAQYYIMQYASSLSRSINSIRAKHLVLKRTFDRHLSQVYGSYQNIYGYDMIRAAACSEHEELRKMDNELVKLEALILEYDQAIPKLERIAQSLKDLSFCRNNN